MIHSDFERGFIKAEVVAFEDFKVSGQLLCIYIYDVYIYIYIIYM